MPDGSNPPAASVTPYLLRPLRDLEQAVSESSRAWLWSDLSDRRRRELVTMERADQ